MRSQDVLTSVGGEAADPVDFDGSMIRIDPITGAAAPGNPLAGGAVAGDDPVIAHGFRNPFRFVFHPVTGAIYVGDVGAGGYEEINVISNVSDGVVENFGWPCWEGPNQQGSFMTSVPVCQDLRDGTGSWVANTTLTSAFFEYSHGQNLAECSGGGSAIAGLAFEDGSNYPTVYDGALFFVDYARECLFVMKAGAGGNPDPAQVELFASVAAVDLVSGPGGNIYYLELFDSGAADPSNTGVLHRFQFSGANQAPAAVINSDVTSGAPPLTVRFDASSSSDADGDPLTYQWDFDGNGSFDATGATPTHIYSESGTFTARLRVTDPAGASDDATRTINVGNTPPIPTIIAPVADLTWQVGDPIVFEGTATDVQDGTLSGASLTWQVLFHHCPDFDCHEHLEVTSHVGTGGQLVASDHEYPSWLEFILTATDSTGASASTSVIVQPETSILTFGANPIGLELVAGFVSTPRVAPFTVEAIVGGQVTATAPSPQIQGGIDYAFLNWSDGGAQSHLVTVPPVDTIYTASFGFGSPRYEDVVLVAPSGRWHFRQPGSPDRTFWYGIPGDVPLFGDWDGDGTETPGMYRPETGFAYLTNSIPPNGEVGFGELEFFFGLAGDQVFSGDWDGDGTDTLGIARNGKMFLRNTNDTGVADTEFFFGSSTDIAFGGDPDGDGRDGIFLYRPSSGLTYFTNDVPAGDVAPTNGSLFFGMSIDRFVIGDWDGDGVDTVGVFRPSDTTVYLRNSNSTGTADEFYVFGASSWLPVAGS
jgi:PKD repeat protein